MNESYHYTVLPHNEGEVLVERLGDVEKAPHLFPRLVAYKDTVEPVIKIKAAAREPVPALKNKA